MPAVEAVEVELDVELSAQRLDASG